MSQVSQFGKGDLVWAKMRGYQMWPGCIVSPPASISIKKYNHWVYFFGSSNFGWVEYHRIKPYREFKKEYSKPSKNSSFLKAVNDIEEFISRTKENPWYKMEEFRDEKDLETKSTITSKSEAGRKRTFKKTYSIGRPSKIPKTADDTESNFSVPAMSLQAYINSGYRFRALDINEISDQFNTKNVTPTKFTIGVIVFGGVGERILKNLINSKHKLRVWHREDQKIDDIFLQVKIREIEKQEQIENDRAAKCLAFLEMKDPATALESSFDDSIPWNTSMIADDFRSLSPNSTRTELNMENMWDPDSGLIREDANHSRRSSPDLQSEREKSNYFDILDIFKICKTPREVVESSDIILCCVEHNVMTKQVMNTLTKAHTGSDVPIFKDKGYVQISNTKVDEAVEERVRVEKFGGRYLHVRLDGTRKDENDGTLLVLADGDRSLFDDCRSIFDVLGKSSVFFKEEAGSVKMSYVLKTLKASLAVSLNEAMLFATNSGFHPEVIEQIFCNAFWTSPYLEEKVKRFTRRHLEVREPDESLTEVHKELEDAIKYTETLSPPLHFKSTWYVNSVLESSRFLSSAANYDPDLSCVYYGMLEGRNKRKSRL